MRTFYFQSAALVAATTDFEALGMGTIPKDSNGNPAIVKHIELQAQDGDLRYTLEKNPSEPGQPGQVSATVGEILANGSKDTFEHIDFESIRIFPVTAGVSIAAGHFFYDF